MNGWKKSINKPSVAPLININSLFIYRMNELTKIIICIVNPE